MNFPDQPSQHMNKFFIAFLLGLAGLMTACGQNTGAETQAIQTLLHGQFDKPDAPLDIAPIAVSGDFAIAGWTQGELGGRALLNKRAQGWVVALCGGDVLKQAAALQEAGVPERDAKRLAEQLAQAESQLPAERQQQLGRLQGLIHMDEHGQHALAAAQPAQSSDHAGHGAHHEQAPGLHFNGAWVRATPPTANVAAAYGQLHNGLDKPVRIVGLTSPLAKTVEIHEMKTVDGQMQMRALDQPEIAAGESLSLESGGYHVMFIGLSQPPKAGDSVELTVELDDGSSAVFTLPVRDAAEAVDAHAHH